MTEDEQDRREFENYLDAVQQAQFYEAMLYTIMRDIRRCIRTAPDLKNARVQLRRAHDRAKTELSKGHENHPIVFTLGDENNEST